MQMRSKQQSQNDGHDGQHQANPKQESAACNPTGAVTEKEAGEGSQRVKNRDRSESPVLAAGAEVRFGILARAGREARVPEKGVGLWRAAAEGLKHLGGRDDAAEGEDGVAEAAARGLDRLLVVQANVLESREAVRREHLPPRRTRRL